VSEAVAEIVTEDGKRYLEWFCPGCRCQHHADLLPEGRWSLAGELTAPTLHPSVNHPERPRCHCWIRAGSIEFLGDCDHHLAGKTVPMELAE